MIYGSWNIRYNRIFCYVGPFFALSHPPPPPTPTIIWCKAPEKRSATNRSFCYFGLFFCPPPPPFPMDPENQNFENIKIMSGDIIILHICNINNNHMIYGSWDMDCEKQNFLSFWIVFCPFTPQTTQKIKILQKWKKLLEIGSFYKWQSYDVWFLRYRARQTEFFVALDHFFLYFHPSNKTKNQNCENKKKTPGDIITLHKCTKNPDYTLHCFWDTTFTRCNLYFSFWVIFCPFTPITNQKLKILKQWKNTVEIIILQVCTKDYEHIM